MDEPPPIDPTRPENPDFSEAFPSKNSAGRQLAIASLWSSFAGLFVAVLAGSLSGNWSQLDQTHRLVLLSIPSVFCAVGIIIGIMGLCRMDLEGRQGILGRAVTGVALNGLLLFLSVFLVVAFLFRAKQDADIKLTASVREADQKFTSEAFRLRAQYESSWAALTNPPVLEMASVRDREAFKEREKKAAEFEASCKTFLEYCENFDENYRHELTKQQLTPQQQASPLRALTNFSTLTNPLIIALRRADVLRAEDLLKLLTFLDDSWGRWHYDIGKKKIMFKTTAEAKAYNDQMAEYNDATLRVALLLEESKSAMRENGHKTISN